MSIAAPYDVASLAETRLVPLIQSLARLVREREQERDAAIHERDLARLESRLAIEERDTLRECFKATLDQLHAVTTLERRHSLQLARRLGLDEHQHLQWMLTNERFDFREAEDAS